MQVEPAKDRRVRKTQRLLREALVSLIREKNYDSIVVKEILNRADVGRSTFYTHFRDKDALLASAIRDILRSHSRTLPHSATGPEKVIWFSRPIFEYLDHHRHSAEPGMGAGGRAVLHRHLQVVLVALIADAIRQHAPGLKRRSRIPLELLTQHTASTYVGVLNWWVESRSGMTPEEVDQLYRALILPALTQAMA